MKSARQINFLFEIIFISSKTTGRQIYLNLAAHFLLCTCFWWEMYASELSSFSAKKKKQNERTKQITMNESFSKSNYIFVWIQKKRKKSVGKRAFFVLFLGMNHKHWIRNDLVCVRVVLANLLALKCVDAGIYIPIFKRISNVATHCKLNVIS